MMLYIIEHVAMCVLEKVKGYHNNNLHGEGQGILKKLYARSVGLNQNTPNSWGYFI